jgi:hypothetical protein
LYKVNSTLPEGQNGPEINKNIREPEMLFGFNPFNRAKTWMLNTKQLNMGPIKKSKI